MAGNPYKEIKSPIRTLNEHVTEKHQVKAIVLPEI
jgi:hypothetical protein